MRFLIPLLAICLSANGLAENSTWTTMTELGETLELQPDEMALIVSVSEPIYLRIAPRHQTSKGLRLRPPVVRECYYSSTNSRDYVNRRTQVVDWGRPFPVSGPCTLRLGTAAVVTVRILSK
jgi:hypothetical protein